MAISVKITELTDIGANLALTTLVPVVNMSGTPTTMRTNMQTLANLVLSSAGGTYVTPANVAMTVTASAQPNITSVGNLLNANVTGNANISGYLLAHYGNFEYANANYFAGDGTNITNVAANTANTVITNAQPNITSVGTLTNLVTSGNITLAANITIQGTTNPNTAVDGVIAFKIPVKINGNTYYIALTAGV